jgi:hypothetical protein
MPVHPVDGKLFKAITQHYQVVCGKRVELKTVEGVFFILTATMVGSNERCPGWASPDGMEGDHVIP